ncbi:hypothetical protein ACJMK2_014371 [Sinanodonta woodiana]|uniref:Uncharacterized protein n=1 Tax=Sinanodonta woodiana TaxID=1069815 RepID=A0ABD3V1Q2_SINWO
MNLPSCTASSSSVSDQFPIPVLSLQLEESLSFSTSPRPFSSQTFTVNSITSSTSTQRHPSEPIVFINVPTDLFEFASNPCNVISGSDVYLHSTSQATSFLMSLANGNNSAVEDLKATCVFVCFYFNGAPALLGYLAPKKRQMETSAPDIDLERVLQEGFDSLPGKHTCCSTWNNNLENIFGITPVESGRKVKSKALTCHMLLTSDEIIKDKRNAEIFKSMKEAEKKERKRKA